MRKYSALAAERLRRAASLSEKAGGSRNWMQESFYQPENGEN
jgi:hypothetical protein